MAGEERFLLRPSYNTDPLKPGEPEPNSVKRFMGPRPVNTPSLNELIGRLNLGRRLQSLVTEQVQSMRLQTGPNARNYGRLTEMHQIITGLVEEAKPLEVRAAEQKQKAEADRAAAAKEDLMKTQARMLALREAEVAMLRAQLSARTVIPQPSIEQSMQTSETFSAGNLADIAVQHIVKDTP